MNNDQLRNLLIYGLIAVLKLLLIAAVAGISAGQLVGFREGEILAPQAVAFAGVLGLVGTGLTTWLDANRPKLGQEKARTDKPLTPRQLLQVAEYQEQQRLKRVQAKLEKVANDGKTVV